MLLDAPGCVPYSCVPDALAASSAQVAAAAGGPGMQLARLALVLATLVLAGCEYGRLARPSVLEQLEPPVVRLINELPQVDRPNEALVGRLFATGGLTRATVGDDGVMRGEVWARPAQLVWTPAVVVMPQGGRLELTFHNPDEARHAAFLPSNGGHRLLELPPRTSGRIAVELDAPGLYWFGCPVGNHAGRGMLGFLFVEGDVPPEARLDRPPQPRPAED
jgi:PQQ system protein